MATTFKASIQQPFPQQPSGGWLPLWLLIAGLLLPVLGYMLLPALGIGAFTEMFGLKKLFLMAGALMGGTAYLYYLRFVLPRPQLLVAFIMLAWPVVACLNGALLNMGVNIHLRPLLLLAIAAPALWISFRNGPLLWRELPWLKYFVLFLLWMTLYSVVFNANAYDPRLSGGEEATADASVSVVQLTSYFYCLLGMTVTGVAALKARNYRSLFDLFNQALLGVSALESLLTIAGYPFGMFTIVLDGFTRAIGIFTHPNPFAHHMGILMVYLLGLFCYYQAERRHRMPSWLLLGGLGINLIAFLLGLSKTALAVFAGCAAIIFLLNLAVPAVRRSLLQILIVLAILLPLGLFAFQALSGQSFFGLLESRIDDTKSLDWRSYVWSDLIADITGASMWLGHGLTAANATVFRLTFNDAKNAQPLMMVHNAYIALIYDMGVMGYLMFVSAASLIWAALKGWLAAIRPALRTEHSIIIALTVYFLVVCGFDEMSYMFDAPQLFWVLATLLYCVSLREKRDAAIAQERPV